MTRVPDRYVLTITVQPAEIDVLGHVNNVVYLQWVQDVAIAHWEASADAQLKAAYHWVVVKHEIEYRQQAKLGDVILVETRVGTIRRTFFERLTEMRRESDGKLVAKARSWWCPIDAASGQTVSVPESIKAAFEADRH